MIIPQTLIMSWILFSFLDLPIHLPFPLTFLWKVHPFAELLISQYDIPVDMMQLGGIETDMDVTSGSHLYPGIFWTRLGWNHLHDYPGKRCKWHGPQQMQSVPGMAPTPISWSPQSREQQSIQEMASLLICWYWGIWSVGGFGANGPASLNGIEERILNK
jgi:hypothetical protein